MILANFFTNSISLWQWGLLALVPPAIVLLYFLKLRRQPIEVPSTYLWQRTIEDLHVNSIWQKLRRNLLLFLQLLLVFLVMFALLRPGWRQQTLVGDRFIIVVDNSASMSADFDGGTRLEKAKEQARIIIDEMESGQDAMIISFSDVSTPVQSFTDNRSELRRKLDAIEPTNRRTDIHAALRYAAALANPGRSSNEEDEKDVQVAAARPATLYIFTDGAFSPPSFDLGNLTPKYVPIGSTKPNNIAITSLATERNPENPDQFQAFLSLQHVGEEEIQVDVELYIDEEKQPRDIVQVTIPAAESLRDENDPPPEEGEIRFDPLKPATAGIDFDLSAFGLGQLDQAVITVKVKYDDDLPLDNIAYAAINPPRPATILLVTDGNRSLEAALSTPSVRSLSQLTMLNPADLAGDTYKDQAAAGAYDLVIYDRCAPESLPASNTLFWGAQPPGEEWELTPTEGPPALLDWERTHPLLENVEVRNVLFIEGMTVQSPRGGQSLMESQFGAVAAIAPREGYEDLVLGLPLLTASENGQAERNTNWMVNRRSFPIFIHNVIRYLGVSRSTIATSLARTGEEVIINTGLPREYIRVTPPSGSSLKVPPQGKTKFPFAGAETIGIYEVRVEDEDEVSQRFAVNLFDANESNLQVRPELEIGHSEVKGDLAWADSRFGLWKWIAIVGLAVLLFEWYIFNRRVYL